MVTAFGKYGDEISFVDYEDLDHKVHSLVAELQLDVLERENTHRESYTVLHYLLHECSAMRIQLPLKLVYNHPRSPDFIAVFPDGSEFGLEITEATTAERQMALKQMAKERQSGQAAPSPDAGINSGLVGSGIERAEKEARQKWAEIVAARVQDKIQKASKYAYAHAMHLIVYSNTGYDFDNTEEAVKLLKAHVNNSAPFESVSVLLGGKYLIGDVFGEHYHHVCYSEFDEIDNAIDYLERTAGFLQERGPVHAWKWIWISLYEAVYSLLICALQGTSPDNVLQTIQCTNEGCKRHWYPGDVRDNQYKCPSCGTEMEGECRENLISFDVALERSQQEKWMRKYVMSDVLVLNEKEAAALMKLRYVASGLLQFVPKTWAIEVPGRDALILPIIGVVERLVTVNHNIFLNDSQKARVQDAIARIRKLLEQPFAADYILQ